MIIYIGKVHDIVSVKKKSSSKQFLLITDIMKNNILICWNNVELKLFSDICV